MPEGLGREKLVFPLSGYTTKISTAFSMAWQRSDSVEIRQAYIPMLPIDFVLSTLISVA